MYHPQRDAISHIKHQKEKVKGVNSKENVKQRKKRSLFNFSFIKNKSIRLFLMSSSISSLGIYTPIFHMVRIYSQQIIFLTVSFPAPPAVPGG